MALYKRTISTSLLMVLNSTTLFIWLKIPRNKLSHATNVLLTLCTCVSVCVFGISGPTYWLQPTYVLQRRGLMESINS